MQNCRAGASAANENQAGPVSNPHLDQLAADSGTTVSCDYLLANRSVVRQNQSGMKRYSLLLGIIIAAVACSSLLAQEKAALQPNASVLSILQGNAGKTVELHLRSGEKVAGRVGQVTDNIVYLSHLTGAEFYDAFVDVKDISAVVIRAAGR
jgi:hypothetical protein